MAPSPLGSVDFLIRPQRARGVLPARPTGLATNHVSLIKELDNQEIKGHVGDIGSVVFRQRDADHDHQPDGTLGVRVQAGSGGPFDEHLEQIGDDDNYPGQTRTSSVDAHVAALPTTFAACFRESKETLPIGSPPDDLLEPCDRMDVLGHNSQNPLTSTPLSVAYEASDKTRVDAQLHTEAKDPADGGHRHSDDLAIDVDEVPSEMRADIVPAREAVPGQTPARKLEMQYLANGVVDELNFAMRKRRTDNSPWENSTYATARVLGIPSVLSGQMLTSKGLTRRMEFFACPLNFATSTCSGPQEQIQRIEFLSRRPGRRAARADAACRRRTSR